LRRSPADDSTSAGWRRDLTSGECFPSTPDRD